MKILGLNVKYYFLKNDSNKFGVQTSSIVLLKGYKVGVNKLIGEMQTIKSNCSLALTDAKGTSNNKVCIFYDFTIIEIIEFFEDSKILINGF